jgi:hypothetical protein
MGERRHAVGLKIRRKAVLAAPVLLVCVSVAATLAPGSSAQQSSGFDPGRISLCFSRWDYSDEDIDLTYGGSFVTGIRWSLPVSENSNFFAGIHHGRDRGDPYSEDETMVAPGAAHLSVTPIEFGARLYTSVHPNRKFCLGIGTEYLRVEESVRGTDPLGRTERPDFTGWGWGLRILGGPEWRFSGGRFAVGAEFSYGFRRIKARWEGRVRDVDLSGFVARGYFAFSLKGPGKEDSR